MSHDLNNKDCQFSREYYNSLVCTCPPAVDTDLQEWANKEAVKQLTELRAELAAAQIDAANAWRSKMCAADCCNRELAAAQIERDGYRNAVNEKYCDQHSFMELKGCPLCELAAVDSAPRYEGDSTYSTGWNDCLAWISQNRKALQEPTK